MTDLLEFERPIASPPMLHAREIHLRLRIAAYVVMLAGYLFYCYNFLLIDYVRPYLISNYGMTLQQTASLSVAQNIFITVGSLMAAPLLARFGRRWTLTAAAFAIGSLAVVTASMHTLVGWVGARALLALFLGAYYVVAVNLTVALFPPQHRAKLSALNSGMFSVAEIMVGGMGAMFGDRDWLLVVWLGVVPLLISPVMLIVIPEDRNFIAYGADDAHSLVSGGWGEMLSARWVRLTLSCICLSGLSFTGYQLFSSFVTLYLRQVRGFSAADMGATVALIGIGSLLGGFFWAFIADRFGRRINALGFIGTACFIGLFLVAPHDRTVLQFFGFCYGVCLSCTYPWGIWFTEIFPIRLRPYGAALFHGGHILSLVAPLLVAWAADRWGLTVAMTFGPAVFLGGAIIWQTLPETLKTAQSYKGWDPETVAVRHSGGLS